MKLIRLILYDIRQGILKNLAKMLPLIALLIVEFANYWNYVSSAIASGALQEAASPTTGNYLSVIFTGIPEYIPSNKEMFPVPFFWLLFFIYLHYFLSAYPRSDLFGYGQNILLRVQNRTIWWTSKIVFTFFAVLVYYIITLLTCLCFGFFTGGVGLQPNEILAEIDISPFFSALSGFQTAVYLLVLPFLVSLSLAVFQLAFDFIASPITSLVVTSVVYIASAYFNNWLLPGEYAMLKRTDLYIPDGVSLTTGICLLGCILIISAAIGYIVFNHFDILASSKATEE